ncbi:unnamed protein product, partial [Polarella glacialis]
ESAAHGLGTGSTLLPRWAWDEATLEASAWENHRRLSACKSSEALGPPYNLRSTNNNYNDYSRNNNNHNTLKKSPSVPSLPAREARLAGHQAPFSGGGGSVRGRLEEARRAAQVQSEACHRDKVLAGYLEARGDVQERMRKLMVQLDLEISRGVVDYGGDDFKAQRRLHTSSTGALGNALEVTRPLPVAVASEFLGAV